MPKKCIYCSREIDDGSVIDFCKNCGIRVWGEKMFNTILKNMEDAKDRGDINPKGLYIGDENLKPARKFG